MQCSDRIALLILVAALLLAACAHLRLRLPRPVVHVELGSVSGDSQGRILQALQNERAQGRAVHEALGKLHLQRGNAAAALEALEQGPLRAQVWLAELRFERGDLDGAIDAVAGSLVKEETGSAKVRARALSVLVGAILQMQPSEEELLGVWEKFQSLSGESSKWKDLEARALVCEASAQLLEALGLAGADQRQEAAQLREKHHRLSQRLARR